MKISDKVIIKVPEIDKHEIGDVGTIEGSFNKRGIVMYKVRSNGFGWYYNVHQIELLNDFQNIK